MTPTPIKRYSRKKIFNGYCFDVVIDKVLWPNQKRLHRDLIIHPGISVVIPQLDANHLILIEQYRYGAGGRLWEIPAGTIDKGETPLQCAAREIQEEIGYKARKVTKLTSCFASPGFSTEIIHCFVATDLVKTQTALEDDEILRMKIFSLAEVKKMLRARKIRDAKTLVPLLYYFGERRS